MCNIEKEIDFNDWVEGEWYYNSESKHESPMQYTILDGVIYNRNKCNDNKILHDLGYNYLHRSKWILAQD